MSNLFKGKMKQDLTMGGKMGSKLSIPSKSETPIVRFKKGEQVELEIQPNSYHIYAKDGRHAYMDKHSARQLKFKTIDDYVLYESINEDLPTNQIDKSKFPNPLLNKKRFLKKGTEDGDDTDDIVHVKNVNISVSKLKPSQDAIYLGKTLGMAINGVEGGDLEAVISKYIKIKIHKCLFIDPDKKSIEEFIKERDDFISS